MNEDDAIRAALSQYFDSSRPAGYAASFRAGWGAGRIYEVGFCTHGKEAKDQVVDLQEQVRNLIGKIKMWEALAEEKNWGYVHDDRLDLLSGEVRRLRSVMGETFDEIEGDLGKLLGLTRTEMKIESAVKRARARLSGED